MSEIRKHYFLSEYCIIAEERAKRPSDFAGAGEDTGKSGYENCLFCGGAEENTPLATAVYKNGKIYADTPEKRVRNWDFRCFPNLYPALSPAPDSPEHRENGLRAEPAYGFHEIIVESPLHGRRLEDFSGSEISGLMQVYRDRTCSYMTREKVLYVSLFKNSGKGAGASINHLHSQLLALPFCPPLLTRELDVIRKKERCPYCAIFDKEKASPRMILENSEWIAFTPYSSVGPFEVWILPEKHVSSLGDCNDRILFALGEILRDILKSYGRVLGNPPFNYMFYQLSEAPEYHLNLRLLPRISVNAGFELGTGIYINTISPERAASYLRGDFTPEG
ncbi:galactose-1-phosphate uridylyltransferase [Methanosarcina sp.]|uniref:galactose-1-phosphate uridylyltransferase n=1 Tax=Methanosarcina sp. TaxID=2213 RepID=UPI003C774703